MVEEFELPQLTKLQTNIPTAEDLQWCGFLEQYDEHYDRISTKTEKKLQVMDKAVGIEKHISFWIRLTCLATLFHASL